MDRRWPKRDFDLPGLKIVFLHYMIPGSWVIMEGGLTSVARSAKKKQTKIGIRVPSLYTQLKTLLYRELWSQSQRRYARPNWNYPGPVAWMAVTLFPLIWHLRFGNSEGEFLGVFSVTTALLVVLMASRASLYNAVSSAHAFRQNTVVVTRTTPYSLATTQLAKLVACLLPLWVELVLNTALQLLAFSLLGGLPMTTVLGANLFLGAVTIVFGCLGAWLGMLHPDVSRAARTSSWVVFVILFFSLLLEALTNWAVLAILASVWTMLKLKSKQRTSVLLISLLVIPLIYVGTKDLPHEFRWGIFNPVTVVRGLSQNQPAEHLLWPEYRYEGVQKRLERHEIERLARSVPPPQAQARAHLFLLPVGLLYLGLAAIFFGWTHTRWRTAY